MSEGRNFRVQVLSSDYTKVLGTVPEYETVSVTWQRLGIGTASLTTAKEGVALEALLAQTRAVPITFSTPGLPRWAGRVVNARSIKPAGQRGQMQITLVDERKFLKRILAAPVPGSPWSAQSTAEHDVRSGPLVTVAKGYIQANIDRLAAEGNPTPIVVVPTAGTDTSPVLPAHQARNKPLDEVLDETLKYHGYDITVTLWLPGDPAVPGLVLSTAAFVVDVTKGRSQSYVRFTEVNGGVESYAMSVTHPEAMGVVVGGPGEGVARQFLKVMATDGRVAALGKWEYPEIWLDATDAEDPATRVERGMEKLAEVAGTAAVSVQLADGSPFYVGPGRDYWVNDLVRAELDGVPVSDRVDRVMVTDNQEGFRVMATFGSARDTESADQHIARTVADVVRRQAALEAGR